MRVVVVGAVRVRAVHEARVRRGEPITNGERGRLLASAHVSKHAANHLREIHARTGERHPDGVDQSPARVIANMLGDILGP